MGGNTMKMINKIYINGQFISPIGQDVMDIVNPSNKEVIGQVTLGNELDTRAAVAAAKAAFTIFQSLQSSNEGKYFNDSTMRLLLTPTHSTQRRLQNMALRSLQLLVVQSLP